MNKLYAPKRIKVRKYRGKFDDQNTITYPKINHPSFFSLKSKTQRKNPIVVRLVTIFAYVHGGMSDLDAQHVVGM